MALVKENTINYTLYSLIDCSIFKDYIRSFSAKLKRCTLFCCSN
jgi:hypothetical protein